jgi:hypothetical protein
MIKPKTFLCGITYSKEIQGIRENIIPISHFFDGLVWTVNFQGDKPNSGDTELVQLLNISCGEGEISPLKWINRYDFPRNRYLFSPKIREGDYLVVLDSLEKMSEDFTRDEIPKLTKLMEDNHLDLIVLHGKTLIVRKNENMAYTNALHEQIRPIQRAAELTQIEGYEDSSQYFTNTRMSVREPFYLARQFMGYYLISPIQCLMGAEGNEELYRHRVANRERFKTFCRNMEIDWDKESITEMFKSRFMDEELREIINGEKILNDYYRLEVLGKKDLTNDHNPANIKPI